MTPPGKERWGPSVPSRGQWLREAWYEPPKRAQETGPLPDATQKGRRLSGGNRVSLPLVQLLGALEGGVRLSTAACEMQQLSKVHERVALHVERLGGLGTFDGLARQ